MTYELYTDGAVSNNGYENAYGGWAWILTDGKVELLKSSGFIDGSTNNICELTAMIKGCQRANDETEPDEKIIVYSDSAYCVNCYVQKWYRKWLANGWKTSGRQPVANRTLWEQLIPFFESEKFTFQKVKAHSGNYWNEKVDKMAVEVKYGQLEEF